MPVVLGQFFKTSQHDLALGNALQVGMPSLKFADNRLIQAYLFDIFRQLCFQVTEQVAARPLSRTRELADGLAKDGFRFAVDQVGTGADAERVLADVPMQFVKLEGALTQGLHLDTSKQEQVGKLARRARDQKIQTVAQRVEDANTMATLWQLGIHFIQGFQVQRQDVVLDETTSMRRISAS